MSSTRNLQKVPLELFFKGIIIGFLLALPIGPTSILCIRYSLSQGLMPGFFSGFGSSFADALYAIFACYGIYQIESVSHHYQIPFHLLGALILFYLGWKSFKEKSSIDLKKATLSSSAALFLNTFTVTATSPLTLIGVSALFAIFSLNINPTHVGEPLLVSFGVLLGAAIWWFVLSALIVLLRKKISIKTIKTINQVAGVLLMLLGILVIVLTFT